MTAVPAATPRKGLAGWWDALLIYRQPRVLAMLFLGFAAGLPFMLVFQTLSAWLRQEGIQRATIGMLAWVGLAYSIKFLWAPIVDHFKLPVLHRWLGRRRSWMLVAQIGIAIGLANLAQADPSSSVQYVALCALFIAFCSATQDIALDAWRIESAPPEMQGGMAAAYQLGYRVAIIAGTAGALWIASETGWRASYTTMAFLMAIGIVTTLLVREPDVSAQGARLEPPKVTEWRRAHAHWPAWARSSVAALLASIVEPVVDFFRRYGLVAGLIIFGFIGGYRLTDYAMGVMTNSFYIDHGYTLKQVATIVKFFGVIASMVGVIIGGVIVAKMGVVRALVLGSVMIMISNCGFAILATTDTASVVGLGVVNTFDFIALGVHGTALIAFLSSLTSASHTATQYAVLSSLYALPGKLLMGTSGFVVEAIDYPAFFLYTASLSIPALLLLFVLVRRYPSLLPAPRAQSAS
jgi:MFS transporter, PAT family, beta-lactamase induction signal transducer AmpG